MESYLIKKKEKALSNMARFLSLLYESTVFCGPILLSEAITLAAEKMDLLKFEVLALYYKAKQRSLIQVECLKDSYSSLKIYVSIASKGVQALVEVIH